MKKIIILLSLSLIVSCSKSEDSTPASLPLTYQNLAGKWNFKSVIRTNGSVVPFVGQCPTKTDYIEAFNYGKIVTYNYYQDCLSSEDNGSSTYYIFPDNFITSAGPIFDNATVKNLTANGFTLEFNASKGLGFMIDVNDAKAIVFEKR
jgi:hypothetical protein